MNRPLAICQVIESAAGGSCRHLIDLSRGLAVRGHRVHVIYSPLRADARYLEQIRALPASTEAIDMRREVGFHDWSAVRAVAAAVRRQGPFDIVHGHSSKAGALIRLAPVGSARRVYTPHAFRGLDPQAGLATKIVFDGIEIVLGAARTDALVAVSQQELEFARSHYIGRGRTHLIRNGLQTASGVTRDQARRRLGVPERAVVFGFVGRISHQKAPERFVEVMRRVLSQVSDAWAVLMDDGENAGAIDPLISQPEFSSRFIRLTGFDAATCLPGFDVLMMTSRYEGLPYVMLESIAAGVPIVTTRTAGADDVIGDTGCGIVVPNGDGAVAALEQAALSLARDDGRRRGMSQLATAQSARLNGPRMVDETEALYRALAGK